VGLFLFNMKETGNKKAPAVRCPGLRALDPGGRCKAVLVEAGSPLDREFDL